MGDFPQALDNLSIKDMQRWLDRIKKDRGVEYLHDEYIPYLLPSYPHLLIQWHWLQSSEEITEEESVFHSFFSEETRPYNKENELRASLRAFLNKYYQYFIFSDWPLVLTKLSEIDLEVSRTVASYLRSRSTK